MSPSPWAREGAGPWRAVGKQQAGRSDSRACRCSIADNLPVASRLELPSNREEEEKNKEKDIQFEHGYRLGFTDSSKVMTPAFAQGAEGSPASLLQATWESVHGTGTCLEPPAWSPLATWEFSWLWQSIALVCFLLRVCRQQPFRRPAAFVLLAPLKCWLFFKMLLSCTKAKQKNVCEGSQCDFLLEALFLPL